MNRKEEFIACSVIAASTMTPPFGYQNSSLTNVEELRSYCGSLTGSVTENSISSGLFVIFSKSSQDNTIDETELSKQRRFISLKKSFMKNLHGFDVENMKYADEMLNSLCCIPFDKNIVSYNEFDKSIDILISLPFNLHASVSRLLEDEDDVVVFNIHRGSKLLVSNELQINELSSKLTSIVEELNETYA